VTFFIFVDFLKLYQTQWLIDFDGKEVTKLFMELDKTSFRSKLKYLMLLRAKGKLNFEKNMLMSF